MKADTWLFIVNCASVRSKTVQSMYFKEYGKHYISSEDFMVFPLPP
jgi:hypothetical protein